MRRLIAALVVLTASPLACRERAEPPPSPPDARDAARAVETVRTAWRARLPTLDVRPLFGGEVARLSAALPTKRPALVTFWATYCPPCIEEMPMFETLAAEGAAIVGVSMDAGNAAEARKVALAQEVSYPMLILEEPSMKAVGLALEKGLPVAVVLDARGDVADVHYGAMDEANARATLNAARR